MVLVCGSLYPGPSGSPPCRGTCSRARSDIDSGNSIARYSRLRLLQIPGSGASSPKRAKDPGFHGCPPVHWPLAGCLAAAVSDTRLISRPTQPRSSPILFRSECPSRVSSSFPAQPRLARVGPHGPGRLCRLGTTPRPTFNCTPLYWGPPGLAPDNIRESHPGRPGLRRRGKVGSPVG